MSKSIRKPMGLRRRGRPHFTETDWFQALSPEQQRAIVEQRVVRLTSADRRRDF